MEHYDVIIIGTGAGGGTLAHKLAPSGKRIVLLERGGYLPREPENWDSREVFGRERYVTDERWIDKHGTREARGSPHRPARPARRCGPAGGSARVRHRRPEHVTEVRQSWWIVGPL